MSFGVVLGWWTWATVRTAVSIRGYILVSVALTVAGAVVAVSAEPAATPSFALGAMLGAAAHATFLTITGRRVRRKGGW